VGLEIGKTAEAVPTAPVGMRGVVIVCWGRSFVLSANVEGLFELSLSFCSTFCLVREKFTQKDAICAAVIIALIRFPTVIRLEAREGKLPTSADSG
jgi:hypothetical protein